MPCRRRRDRLRVRRRNKVIYNAIENTGGNDMVGTGIFIENFFDFFAEKFARVEISVYICNPKGPGNAEIAQLVEHNLAKVGVASSSLVFRS